MPTFAVVFRLPYKYKLLRIRRDVNKEQSCSIEFYLDSGGPCGCGAWDAQVVRLGLFQAQVTLGILTTRVFRFKGSVSYGHCLILRGTLASISGSFQMSTRG